MRTNRDKKLQGAQRRALRFYMRQLSNASLRKGIREKTCKT